ncbi:MAG: tetratricopeptide repeat protein [Verrucomicrobia bacterium]|nr:tetratricopeptide repeat protein [Verrucomicrobiota bacterium]
MKVQRTSEVRPSPAPNPIPLPAALDKVSKTFFLKLDPTLSIEERQYACFEGVFERLRAKQWISIPLCTEELSQLTDREGRSLLIRALDLYPNDHDLAVALATSKIALDRVGPGENSPLHYAARTENCKVIELLYSPTSALKRNNNNQTPLDVAANLHQVEAIRTLLNIPNLIDRTPTWATFFNLGNRFFDEGHLPEAKGMYLEALAVAESAFVPDVHGPQLGMNLHNLGCLHFSLKEYDKALFYWEKEYEIRLKLRENVTDLLKDIALIYALQGNEIEALKTLTKAWELMEHASATERAALLNHTGICYFHLARYQEAIQMHEKAYKMLALLEEKEIPLMIECLEHLAKCHEQLADMQTARNNLVHALGIATRLYGLENPITQKLKERLQTVDTETKDFETLLQVAIATRQAGRIVTLLTQNEAYCPSWGWNRLFHIGIKLAQEGALLEALEIHLKALQIAKAHFKEEDPEVISSLRQVADCCFQLKRYANHRAYLREQIPLVKNDPSQERILLYKIADSYFCESRFEEASRAYENLLSPSPSSPSEMEILILIGYCYLGMGSYHRAIQYFQMAYMHTALQEKKDNKLLIRALSGLVKCYEYLNDVAQISHRDQLLCLLEEQDEKAP